MTTEHELPPLPKASKMYDIPGYDEEELKDYARAAIEADRKCRQSEAEEVCGEAYQVVGSLLSDLGIFETDHAKKILDNLSQAKMVHKDVLPWPSFDRQRRGEPVAWRYLTPTGWHATTDAARALGIAEHHTVEPLYATPQSDDFSARLSRIEDSMKAGARLTKHRFKLDAPQPAEPCALPISDKTTCGSKNGDCDSQPAEPEHATLNLQPSSRLQPVATAFFTEKGEVAFTGIYDRTLKALEAVKTTRLGISSGSIDLYAAPQAAAPVNIYVETRECHECGHVGINDAHGSKAACNSCDWTGYSPNEDRCPGCGQDGTMTAACPTCGGRYGLLAEKSITCNSAPAAQPAEPVKNTCKKCNGTGVESTRFHGVWPNGEECLEPIKCDQCDGFGTTSAAEPVKVPSDDDIRRVARDMYLAGDLVWLGFDKDENGEYTQPKISSANITLIRALLARYGKGTP